MTVIHILIGMFKFFYRNVLFVNSNMMHMLPTVHIILEWTQLVCTPASRSLIVRPGIHVTSDVITYHCSA